METDRLRGAKLLRRRIRKSKWRNGRRTGKWRRVTTLILASILARSRQERELGRGSLWETTGTGTRQYHLQPKLCWTELCCLVLGVSGGKGSGNHISDDVADQLSRLLVAVRLGTPWRKKPETKKAACLTESCQKFWCRVEHLSAKRRSHAISYSRHRLCLILSRSICLLIWSNLAWPGQLLDPLLLTESTNELARFKYSFQLSRDQRCSALDAADPYKCGATDCMIYICERLPRSLACPLTPFVHWALAIWVIIMMVAAVVNTLIQKYLLLLLMTTEGSQLVERAGMISTSSSWAGMVAAEEWVSMMAFTTPRY